MKNKYLDLIKNKLKLEIDNKVLIRILFDINRYFDKNLTISFQSEQKRNDRIFNSVERKALRNFFYHGHIEDLANINLESFPEIKYTQNDVDIVCKNTLKRLEDYDPEKILNSIKQRFNNLVKYKKSSISFRNEWLEFYNQKRTNLFEYSVFILRIDNKDFELHNHDESYIYRMISSTYEKLENYRHLIMVFDKQIYDKYGNDITWNIIYKTTLYAEGFINYKDNYNPCKKTKQIEKLSNFLKERFENKNIEKLSQDFYSTISTGYKFEDCYIEENQNTIILSLKKISRDESPVPCPSCMTTIQSGNSYPEMFLRSYECKNPNCQDRSKSGRGKRFDEYGVYRSFKLEENKLENKISNELYNIWRRDVFPKDSNWLEMILKYYAWDNEEILVYNLPLIPKNTYSRIIKQFTSKDNFSNPIYAENFDDLNILKLFKNVYEFIDKNSGTKLLTNKIEVVNDNSSYGIKDLLPGQIGTAITSPPYYNAREYSQWTNMLLYYIDMLINASSIYNTLADKGNYLYNIGDIVCEDNVYVESHMSNRRLPLGFLSCMIFEIAGFNLSENIIWDKGQVQSKRNSTINLFSGYVKCINCYEHVFVFTKNATHENTKTVAAISPVIKINSKGENTYKHTAPYPLELVNLVKPYLQKDKYLLDPFLGSGTTLTWCRLNNQKGVGYELNEDYYNLALEKIYKKEKEDK